MVSVPMAKQQWPSLLEILRELIIANESEIYYNAEIRKSGSPFTRSSNANIDHGKWKLPGDRLFRGRRRSVIDASGTSEGSGTPRFYDDRLARYFLYQLGHPTNEMDAQERGAPRRMAASM